MGTWGAGPFENDDAADWAWQFEASDGIAVIEETLDRVFEEAGDDYIEAPTGSEAVAACEVIARLRGHGCASTVYGEATDKWIAANPVKPSDELLSKANNALDLITSKNSELHELWHESESFTEWEKNITDLRKRMNS